MSVKSSSALGERISGRSARDIRTDFLAFARVGQGLLCDLLEACWGVGHTFTALQLLVAEVESTEVV
jgi:hypothetical protein